MPTATVTSKGQTTIPRAVREFLKVKSGDRLEFRINPGDNTVTIQAANMDIGDLKDMLKRKAMKPYNPEERKISAKARALRK